MKLTKSESTGSKVLYIGAFSGRIVSVSPTKQELCKLLGIEEDKIKDELEYAGEKDGKDWVKIDFWIESNGPIKQLFKESYRLTNEVSVSKNSGKTEFVSQNGDNGWADKEDNLLETFTHWSKWDKEAGKMVPVVDEKGKKIPRDYREAIQGEKQLYNFLKAWFAKVDLYNVSNDTILIDVKKLFRDPVKYAKSEYQSLIGQSEEDNLVGDIIELATVYVGEKDGQKVQYQNLSKHPLPGYLWPKFNLAMNQGIWDKSKGANSTIAKWHSEITDSEHGLRENYLICPLKEYDETGFLNESNEVLSHSSDESSPSDTEY